MNEDLIPYGRIFARGVFVWRLLDCSLSSPFHSQLRRRSTAVGITGAFSFLRSAGASHLQRRSGALQRRRRHCLASQRRRFARAPGGCSALAQTDIRHESPIRQPQISFIQTNGFQSLLRLHLTPNLYKSTFFPQELFILPCQCPILLFIYF